MPDALTQLEREVIALFVQVASVLNLPRSVGEIYGLLYVSESPLCLNDFIDRLGLSKGSISQSLKILRSFGATKPVYVPGSRRDYFIAERELRRMTGGFLSEQVQPHLDGMRTQIKSIETLNAGNGHKAPAELTSRVKQLRKWERRATLVLPLFMKFIRLRDKASRTAPVNVTGNELASLETPASSLLSV